MATCYYTPCDKDATHTVEVDGEKRPYCHRHGREAASLHALTCQPVKID